MLKLFLFLFFFLNYDSIKASNFNIKYEKIYAPYSDYRFTSSFNSKFILNYYKNEIECAEGCSNNTNCLGYIYYPWIYRNNHCQTLNNLGIVIKTEKTSNFTNVIKYIEYNNTNFSNFNSNLNIVYFKNNSNTYIENYNNNLIIYKNIENINLEYNLNNPYIYFYNNCSVIFQLNKNYYDSDYEIYIDSLDSKVQAKLYYSTNNINYYFLGTLNNNNKNFTINNLNYSNYLLIKFDFYYKKNRFRKYLPIKYIDYQVMPSLNINTTLSNTPTTTDLKTIILNNNSTSSSSFTSTSTSSSSSSFTSTSTSSSSSSFTSTSTSSSSSISTSSSSLTSTSTNSLSLTTTSSSINNKNETFVDKFLEDIEENINYILFGLVILLLIISIYLIVKYYKKMKKNLKRSQEQLTRLDKELKRRKLDSRVIHNEVYQGSELHNTNNQNNRESNYVNIDTTNTDGEYLSIE